jgi:hypothetical protein
MPYAVIRLSVEQRLHDKARQMPRTKAEILEDREKTQTSHKKLRHDKKKESETETRGAEDRGSYMASLGPPSSKHSIKFVWSANLAEAE